MSGGEAIDDIDAALFDALGTPEVAALTDPRKRRAREKRMSLSPTDGRRKRKTGRTAQFNVKIRADLKAQVLRASRDHRLLIAEVVESALMAYLPTLEKRDA